jgi:hypothetical protein
MRNDLIVCLVEAYKPQTITQRQPIASVLQKSKSDSWANATLWEVPVKDIEGNLEILDSMSFVYTRSMDGTDRSIPEWTNPTTHSIQKITRTGLTWADWNEEAIYTETTYPAFFQEISQLSWNGSQLMFAPVLNSIGSKYVNSILSLTRSGTGWTDLQKINVSDRSANGVDFGVSLIRSANSLLVGSHYDSEAGSNAGAINIFDKDINGVWVKTGKILPPNWNSYFNILFGNSFAATDEVMVVCAPDYGTYNELLNAPTGLLYIYERTGFSWASNQLIQTIEPPSNNYRLEWDHIAMSENTLVVTYRDFVEGDHGIAVYENTPAGFILNSIIPLDDIQIQVEWRAVTVRDGNIFLFTGVKESGLQEVLLLTKGPSTWSVQTTFQFPAAPDDVHYYYSYNYRNLALEVREDSLLVGVPWLTVDNKEAVGGVFTFSKTPGTSWPAGTVQHSSLLLPDTLNPQSYFGHSLAIRGNILLVGAPGAYFTPLQDNTGALRNKSGAAFMYAAIGNKWTSVSKLQGSESNRSLSDQFGGAVTMDTEYLFVSAYFENNQYGAQAGSVYAFPLIKEAITLTPGPQDVACETQLPIALKATPPGGTWEGIGVNQSAGTFTVGVLPNGKYPVQYNYAGPTGCIHSALDTVLVDVIPEGMLSVKSDDYCTNGFVTLGAVPKSAEITTLWYYQESSGTDSVLIDTESMPERNVNQEGYYQCYISNDHCHATTNVLEVTKLNNLTISIQPTDTLLTLCEGTDAFLVANSSRQDALLNWFFKAEGNTEYEILNDGGSTTVAENGFYMAQAKLTFCEVETAPVRVQYIPVESIAITNVITANDDELNSQLIVLKHPTEYSMSVLNAWGIVVYQDSGSKPWNGGDASAGVYYWILEYKDCRNEEHVARGWVQLLR